MESCVRSVLRTILLKSSSSERSFKHPLDPALKSFHFFSFEHLQYTQKNSRANEKV